MTTEGTPNQNSASDGEKPEGQPAVSDGGLSQTVQPKTEGDGAKLEEFVVPDEWKSEDGSIDPKKIDAQIKDLKGKIPTAPEKYEVVRPDGIPSELLPDDDPLLASFHEVAKKHNLSQEAVNEAVSTVMKFQMEALSAMRDNNLKVLGKDGPEIVKRVSTWAKSILSPEEYVAMQIVATSADGMKALDKMRRAAISDEKIPTSTDSSIPKGLTKEEVDGMMKSDDYWNPSSPNYRILRDKVTQFYASLNKSN